MEGETVRFDHVLVVGAAAHPEFQQAWQWLRGHSGVLHGAESPSEACSWIRQGAGPPQLVVVVQTRPGQIRQWEVEALHRAAPLARLVALLGSWCEGETCSGEPWTGVLRLYWHEFVSRVRRESAGVRVWAKAWNLPRPGTEAERVDTSCRPLVPRQGSIAIATSRHADYEGLAEACLQAGYATVWIRSERQFGKRWNTEAAMAEQVQRDPSGSGPGSHPSALPGSDPAVPGENAGTPPTAVLLRESTAARGITTAIWDDSCLQSIRPLPLAQFSRQLLPAPTIALLHFPRGSDWRRALRDGAAGVHSKPFSLDDLLSDIEHCVGIPQRSPRTGCGGTPYHTALSEMSTSYSSRSA